MKNTITFSVGRWQLAAILYLVLVALLMALRPPCLFQADGSPKPWGVGTDAGKSVIGVQILFPLLAILCYYAVVCIALVFKGS